jgi:hypothetical protein
MSRTMTRRTDKQLGRLDALEAEFRRDLVHHLRICAAGRDSLLFLVSSLRPEFWPPNVRSSVADTLFATASEILDQRAQLEVDRFNCLAALYRDACRRHVDLGDHHRPGPRQQAQQLLLEIGERV